ncbi:MAG: TIGR03620 family F420-dependent LLM class oxidoreductase [Pseudomonadales bacterium]|nr:TIGR03620 family F420-dependent LLM class oxidoreductase [Pseudomonadales bacterium]MCP5185689.1 TIGR03620 family F420-dependent LLM class oxidoreductase [Pseudomonadales bacterium]
MMELGRLGVWYFLDGLPAPEAAAAAQRIEALGYGTLWIPESVGRNPLVHASWLLANTRRLNIATGIANIYHREPGVTLSGQLTLAEQSGGRFLLGLGVSHKPMVEGVRGLAYGAPVPTMRTYLERMAASPYTGIRPAEPPPTVIAALGPKMLELAATKAQGAHPYFTSPDHTAMARKVMGKGPLLCVEQKVILETDAGKARELARPVAKIYLGLPNYRNNWLRMGLTEADLENGGSDRFIDATFAWGNTDAIRRRLQEHLDAGADHVCVQPVNPNGVFGDLHWAALEEIIAG